MRILFLNHTGASSGAENAMLRLLEALPAEHARAVACPPDGALKAAIESRGVEQFDLQGTDVSFTLHPLKTPRGLMALVRSAISLRGIARRFRADVVHANSVRAGLIAVTARHFGGPPVLVQCHDNLPASRVGDLTRAFIARGADIVVAVSDSTAGHFNRGFRIPKAERIHISVDRARFSPAVKGSSAIRSELGLPPTARLLAHVAQITPWKGQDTAIRALQEVREHAEAHLLIIGEIAFASQRYDNVAFRASLDHLTQSLELDSAVHFLGQRADAAELIGAAELLLLPSWEEPFGLVVAEGMAVGVPVLVTDRGGVREYVTDGVNGRVLPPRDVAAWSTAILELLADREAVSRMAHENIQTAAYFNDERYSREMLAAYARATQESDHLPGPASIALPRLRILCVNHTAVMAGAEHSLLDLLANLPDGVEATVACPDGELAEHVREHGLPWVSLPSVDISLKLDPRFMFRGMVAALRAARRLRHSMRFADVVHANSIRAGAVCTLATRARLPLVVHARDCLPAQRLTRILARIIARRAIAVVANSGYTAECFRAAVAPEAVDLGLVHGPVDLQPFLRESRTPDVARRTLGLRGDEPVLGIVAQITPWKAQDQAIRILSRVRQSSHPGARLLVVGSPRFTSAATRYDNRSYAGDLHSLVKELGLENAVSFLGERPDVPLVMRSLDVLLVPSAEEPFGRVVVEGMAAGCAVVATDRGGPAEVLRNGQDGVVLPPGDPDRWSRVIGELLGDPERRASLAAAARARAEAEYDAPASVAALVRIWERTQASPPPMRTPLPWLRNPAVRRLGHSLRPATLRERDR